MCVTVENTLSTNGASICVARYHHLVLAWVLSSESDLFVVPKSTDASTSGFSPKVVREKKKCATLNLRLFTRHLNSQQTRYSRWKSHGPNLCKSKLDPACWCWILPRRNGNVHLPQREVCGMAEGGQKRRDRQRNLDCRREQRRAQKMNAVAKKDHNTRTVAHMHARQTTARHIAPLGSGGFYGRAFRHSSTLSRC